MKNSVLLRRGLLLCLLIAVFVAGMVTGQKKNKYGTPTSVIHLVSLKWKNDSTPEQRQKAVDGIKEMAALIPGIKNLWLKPLRVQSPTQEKKFEMAFAIEFESEAAAKAYADDPRHSEWSKQIYEPIRDESRSFQVTNEAPAKK